MHLSIRRYQSPSPAEVTRHVNEGFVPVVAQAPGFVAYYAIEDGANHWISVSVFETKEGAEGSDRLAADWRRDHVAAWLSGPPEVTAGAVVAHARK